jgi:hypothetical protein
VEVALLPLCRLLRVPLDVFMAFDMVFDLFVDVFEGAAIGPSTFFLLLVWLCSD